MLGKGYIFRIYFCFSFFAEALVYCVFVFIAILDRFKLLDQMLLLERVISVN